MKRHKLRDLRVLDLPECEARVTLALVAIARGCTRIQVRKLLHKFDYRFTNTEFTQWRQAVYLASVLSETLEIQTPDAGADRQTQALAALRCQGITREEARRDHGLTFTDTDWTKAGELIADQNSAS